METPLDPGNIILSHLPVAKQFCEKVAAHMYYTSIFFLA